ncbi:MAG: TIGR03936 family radical SAM-associated protein [Planctomycetota bacterium]
MVRQRVRIRFRKQGDLRLVGHRDLARSMERLFRRAGLRLGMSEGFHPKPRMSFPSALAVGIEGLDEVMELELAEHYSEEELLRRLASQALCGLAFESVEILPPGTRKARLKSAVYRAAIPAERRAEVAERTTRLLAASSCPVTRLGKPGQIDVRPFLQELTLRDGLLTMRLSAGRGQSAGPRDVLQALGLPDLEAQGTHLTRSTVELEA